MWGSDAMKTENEKMLKDAGADRKKARVQLHPLRKMRRCLPNGT